MRIYFYLPFTLVEKQIGILGQKEISIMNRITELFQIKYQLIQAGMVWVSGNKLASAVSNAGGLGLLGAGSMYPDVLRNHIRKCQSKTRHPFGVNIPLFYPDLDEILKIVIDEGVKIVFTSAGNPGLYTELLQSHGIKVAHVVSSVKFAKKAEAAGVDAIVAEGFEAGGHNGREETTTFTLIPMVREAVKVPLIAAGGIASGRGMLAAMALGAEGVQVGSRFVASNESSAHMNFKEAVVQTGDGDTHLTLKELTPVRLIKNDFYDKVMEYYRKQASVEELRTLLGRGRAKKGMFEGDLVNGELEIGQIAGLIHDIKPAADILREILMEYGKAKKELPEIG